MKHFYITEEERARRIELLAAWDKFNQENPRTLQNRSVFATQENIDIKYLVRVLKWRYQQNFYEKGETSLKIVKLDSKSTTNMNSSEVISLKLKNSKLEIPSSLIGAFVKALEECHAL